MKNPLTYFILICIFFGTIQTTNAQKCGIIKNNWFEISSNKEDVLAKFTDSEYTEYHGSKEIYIKAKIDWISSCEYNLILTENTIPNLPFKAGDKLHVIVNNVRGRRKVFYTATIGDRKWEGKMIRVKKGKL